MKRKRDVQMTGEINLNGAIKNIPHKPRIDWTTSVSVFSLIQ